MKRIYKILLWSSCCYHYGTCIQPWRRHQQISRIPFLVIRGGSSGGDEDVGGGGGSEIASNDPSTPISSDRTDMQPQQQTQSQQQQQQYQQFQQYQLYLAEQQRINKQDPLQGRNAPLQQQQQQNQQLLTQQQQQQHRNQRPPPPPNQRNPNDPRFQNINYNNQQRQSWQQQQQQQRSQIPPQLPLVSSSTNYDRPFIPTQQQQAQFSQPNNNNVDEIPEENFDDDDEVEVSLPENTLWDPKAPSDILTGSTSSNTDGGRTNFEDLASFDKDFILKGLAQLYRKKILPLELASRYGHFHSPPLSPSDFDSPPMILLLGQYSVGKTSFVKYLLGRDFPGIRVGPEPTTDRFTALLYGTQDKIIPGAALCSQLDRPFTGLNPFGNNFLSRLEAVEINAPILRNITVIDTPGILSGQKQKSRNYDYEAVMKWFAERADLIIVMFDAHKLDISDELKAVMNIMIPHLDKIRIVLNKADSISTQQLLRVYGALMWSLGKVMNTPEVSRVYVGSFWDAPLQNSDQIDLLQQEEMDLLHDIMSLPQHAVMRRINELVKRARSVKVHAYIIHYLRKQLPYNPWMRKEKQLKLIRRLETEFNAAARRYGLPKGDFPLVEPMRQALLEIKDLSEFPKLDKRLVREMDKVFSVDISELLKRAKSK